MASSSYTISLPLQLPQCASSARIGLGAPSRPSPSARLQTTTTKGLRSVKATLYLHEAAGHGDNGGGIAATTSALHLVAGDDDLRAAARVRGGAPRSPKGRPGAPREGSGGAGGKVHAATPPTLLRLPKEGSGGQGGSIH